MAPKSKDQKPKELDLARKISADPRDPRYQEKQWPCEGRRPPGTAQSNRWGQWTHCARCNLRLEYVPMKDAPPNSTQALNHADVKRALDELQRELPHTTMPDAEMVKSMIDKVTAENRVNTLIKYAKEKTLKKDHADKTAVKTGAKPSEPSGYPSQIPVPSTPRSSSWAMPSAPSSPNYLDYLTEEEMQQLRNRVRDRMNASQQPSEMTDQPNLEPDYSFPTSQ